MVGKKIIIFIMNKKSYESYLTEARNELGTTSNDLDIRAYAIMKAISNCNDGIKLEIGRQAKIANDDIRERFNNLYNLIEKLSKSN